MATFKFYAGALFGPSGVGIPIYGQITFSYNTGLKLVDFKSSSGSYFTLYDQTDPAVTTSISGNTLTSSIDLNLTGVDLIFTYNNSEREIYAKHNSSSKGGINLFFFESRKFR